MQSHRAQVHVAAALRAVASGPHAGPRLRPTGNRVSGVSASYKTPRTAERVCWGMSSLVGVCAQGAHEIAVRRSATHGPQP